MITSTMLSTLGEQEFSSLYLLIDLLLKSTIILVLTLLLSAQFRKRAASDLSMLWMVAIAALLFLPLFQQLLPTLPVAVAINASEFTTTLLANFQNLALNFGQANPDLASATGWIVLGYAAVSLCLILYLTMGLLRVVLLTRSADQLQHAQAQEVLQRLQAANGITSPITLLQCKQCRSPVTWGVYRHKILLPPAITNWDEALIAQILSHELAHIQRRDWMCYMLSRLTLCLYWINPLVWVAHRRLVMESEKSCDDAAIDDTGCPISYAENLLRLAGSLNTQQCGMVAALLGRKSALAHRVHYILRTRDKRRHSDRSCLISGLLIIALLTAPFSALTVNINISERSQVEQSAIPVHFIPRDSFEYRQFMRELGRT